MEKSKVYFTDFRTGLGTPLTVKLQKLIKLAGISSIDFDNKFVAIKMHFGELGNLAYLRPNYAKAVADVIKELGGMPFLRLLTDEPHVVEASRDYVWWAYLIPGGLIFRTGMSILM